MAGRMKIRALAADDVGAIMACYRASIHGLAAPYYSAEQLAAWAPATPDRARWEMRLDQLRTFVAEVDGAMAGFISFADEGYLDFLFTHPDCARRGVATALYEKMETRLRAIGTPEITTHASLAARPFFDRHGFAVTEEEMADCRGVALRRFAMRKALR